MSRKSRASPHWSTVEPLEPRVLLSLVSKLPDLSTLREDASFFDDLQVTLISSHAPIDVALGAAPDIPFGSVDVNDHGKILRINTPANITTIYQNAEAASGYALVPMVDWGDGLETSGAPAVRAENPRWGETGPGPTHIDLTGSHPFALTGLYHVKLRLYAVPEAGVKGSQRLLATTALDVQVSTSSTNVPGSRVLHPIVPVNSLHELHLATLTGYHPPATSGITGNIYWYDGTTTNASVVESADGTIDIYGTHWYASTGTFPVSIGLQQWLTSGLLIFRPMPTTVTVVPVEEREFSIIAGRTLSAALGAIDRPAIFPPTATPITYRVSPNNDVLIVTIMWGDGQTSDGQFLSNASGGYDILGTHTYARAGSYRIRLEINLGHHAVGAHYTLPYEYHLDQLLFATVMVRSPYAMNSFTKIPTPGTF